MLMVISIATMTLVAIVAALLAFYRSNTVIFNQALAVQSARQGLSSVSGDARGAQYGDDGAYPVASIATSSFTFYSDVDADGSAERVHYYLSGSNFIRGLIHATGTPAAYPSSSESTTTVATAVRNWSDNVAVFHFYTASSTEITTVATSTAVAYITVTLVVDVDPNNRPLEYTLRTTAALRNSQNF